MSELRKKRIESLTVGVESGSVLFDDNIAGCMTNEKLPTIVNLIDLQLYSIFVFPYSKVQR